MLNVLLLVTCILVVLGSVIYFFYLNRILGYTLGLLIRLGYWNQASSGVWVDFGAIHFSIIAGRVIFKNINYHSSNQTVRIVKCQFSWRYWIRRTAEEEDLSGREASVKEPLPCRIHINVEGLEWFLYNRTPAYDDIISRMGHYENGAEQGRASSRTMENPVEHRSADGVGITRQDTALQPSSDRSGFVTDAVAWLKRQLPNLDPKLLLPFSFEASKAAIIFGNHGTENLMIAQFTTAHGTYGIIQSRSRLDLHKQMLRINFVNATINCIPNKDHWNTMLSIGGDVQEHLEHQHSDKVDGPMYLAFRRFHRLWRHSESTFMFSGKSNRKLSTRPDRKKAIKKPEEEAHIGVDFSSLEYAIERKLLETPKLELTYYADVAGAVPDNPLHLGSGGLEEMDIGNGDLPPQWGVDLITHGGFIRFGPWADRQRAQIQRAFFPQSFHNITPTQKLASGDLRTCTCLRVFWELRGVTSLHIPFREASKNWQWDGLSNVHRSGKQREAASLQLRAGDKSTLTYLMPMVATREGYNAFLEVHMDDINVTSSLNDIKLLGAESLQVSCHMPSPLEWNSSRQWTIGMSFRRPVLYIIRDHVNMLTDLGKDWSSGPPHDFHCFIPTVYAIELHFNDFELNLYANDHNIIDRPLARDENTLFTFRGGSLRNAVTITADKYRPLSTAIPFSVDAPDVTLSLTLPRWNINGMHATPRVTEVGRLASFHIDGSYLYFANVRGDYIDQLKLNIQARSPAIKVFGWAIRHVMVLRDNYFGSFTQFSTTGEYMQKTTKKVPIGDPIEIKYRPGKSNAFQVEMLVNVDDATVLMPAGLPGFEKATSGQEEGAAPLGASVVYLVPLLQVQFRLHDYYMEMSLNIDPFVGAAIDDCPDVVAAGRFADLPFKEVMSIEGIDITANRLFGPQPRTSTYVCIWEIHIGQVKLAMTAHQGEIFQKAGQAFVFNFSDPFNAPASIYALPPDPDATFLKVTVDSVEGHWLAPPAVVRVSLPGGLLFDSNDLAGKFYRKVMSMRVPVVDVHALMSLPSRRRWMEAAHIHMSVGLDIYKSPEGWRKSAEWQKKFLLEQDAQTKRAVELTGESLERRGNSSSRNPLFTRPARFPAIQPITQGDSHHVRQRSVHSNVQLGYPRMEASSGSDEEFNISEADRDFRLSKSRPSMLTIPMQRTRDDQNFSSGDESDEADSDVSNRSWSDLSDCDGDSTTQKKQQPRVSYYWDICRHFCLPSEASPSRWTTSSVSLLQDYRPKRMDCSHTMLEKPSRTFLPREQAMPPPEDDKVDRTLIRFSASDEIQIFATPLLSIVGPILLGAAIDESNPEILIDNMIQAAVKSVTPSPSTTLVEIKVPAVRISVVQDLMSMSKSLSLITSNHRKHHIESAGEARVASVVELCVHGGYALCNIPPIVGAGVAASAKLELGTIAFALGTLLSDPGRRRIPTLPSPSPVLSLDVGRTSGVMAHRKAHLDIGACRFLLYRSAPEMAIATTQVLGHALEAVADARKAFASQARRRRQRLLRHTLIAHRDKSTSYILSTIQPSFLVQSGKPGTLRQMINWRFLFQLRHSLIVSKKNNPATLESESEVSLEPEIAIHEINRIFDFQSNVWVIDGEPISSSHVPELQAVYHDLKKESPAKGGDLSQWFATAISMTGQSVEVLYQEGAAVQNQFLIKSIYMRAHAFDRQLLEGPTTPTSRSPTLKGVVSEKSATEELPSVTLAMAVEDVSIKIFPSIISFIQHVLHVQRLLSHSGDGSHQRTTLQRKASRRKSVLTEIEISIHGIDMQAAAENIIFGFSASGFTASTFLHTASFGSASHELMANQYLGFQEVSIQAKERLGPCAEPRFNDTLAAVVLSKFALSVVFQQDAHRAAVLRCNLHLLNCELSVPRSALRLYHFLQQWRDDYLPALDAMMQALFKEIRAIPDNHPSQPPPPPAGLNVHLNASIVGFLITLQVMHGTWLSWKVEDIVSYARSGVPAQKGSSYTFGLSVGSQTIRVSSRTSAEAVSKATFAGTSITLALPSIRTSGSYDGGVVKILALVDVFQVNIKPSHWDAMLSVQQKFGQDFNDLLLLVGDNRKRHPAQPASRVMRPTSESIIYSVSGRFEGFRIGLRGPASTQYLECDDIDGTMTNAQGMHWHIDISDLALSLSPHTTSSKSAGPGVDRRRRSAFVITDFQVSNKQALKDSSPADHFLDVSVTKLHAVMQPSSISEVGDFVDHLQTELHVRKQQRAHELNEFKEKAKVLMRTFDVNPRSAPITEANTFLGKHHIKLTVARLGVAFPLSFDQNIEAPHANARDTRQLKAFLFSIKLLTFETHHGESGRIVMEGFSFQFVPKFRQSIPGDFSGEAHQTRNRLVYPEMAARLQSTSSPRSRRFVVGANISGFILDLDPTVTEYTFALIDVYRHGKNRVEKLTTGLPRITPDQPTTTPASETAEDTPYSSIPTSSVQASLKFLSGKVRMHSGYEKSVPRTSSLPFSHLSESTEYGSPEADVFNLPELSVWCDYRATPTHQKVFPPHGDLASQLIFQSTIHSSQNVLRPTLLPFLTEIMRNFEDRMRKSAWQLPRPPSIATTQDDASMTDTKSIVTPNNAMAAPAIVNLQISFSLRIDQSRLELTCQPDVNVVAGLHWESGGFVVNFSPGGHTSITGTVAGLTTSLRHGFLTADCARVDARDLKFSITFSKAAVEDWKTINSVTIVVDTEIAGGVRLSRLQDILCFKAVWLDRIPILSGDAVQTSSTPSRATSSMSASTDQLPKQGFSTSLVVRVRKINLEADLGQSISVVQLELRSVLARTRLTDEVSEVSISMDHIDLIGNGNLSGNLGMPDFYFHTVRRRQSSPLSDAGERKMLELTVSSGALNMKLESDKQWLLQYRADPLRVNVYDDWTMIDPSVPKDDRQLRLFFTVLGTKVVTLMTAGTIPKLIVYAGKFTANLEAQREGASRESSIFRSIRGPKPENALSEVANAMFQSARSKFKEAENISYAIGQHMSLQLEELIFVLFPRALDDTELARFVGRNVRAQLERMVDPHGFPAQRNLRLSLSHMAIAQLVRYPISYTTFDDVFQWSQQGVASAWENVIFSLPAMDMRMLAQEGSAEGVKQLLYDFDSKFVRHEDKKDLENINITFNLGLYSWLTGLHKTFSRELKRSQEIADWRPGHVTAPSLSAVLRSRVAEQMLEPTREPPASVSMQPTAEEFAAAVSSSQIPLRKAIVPQIPTIAPLTQMPKVTRMAGATPESSMLAEPTLPKKSSDIIYVPRSRHIERLTVRQLGEATPDVMHPFFTKKAGFNLETALPQYVHEYATLPVEEIMKVLGKIYIKQLRTVNRGNGS